MKGRTPTARDGLYLLANQVFASCSCLPGVLTIVSGESVIMDLASCGCDDGSPMGTDQKTPAWQYLLLLFLAAGLLVALILTRQSPRSLLILSTIPAVAWFLYPDWSREVPWKKLPNVPGAIYFLYCSVVLWYVHSTYWHLYALGPLSLAVFCGWRAVRNWHVRRSVTPASN